jgi:hypothetical protein
MGEHVSDDPLIRYDKLCREVYADKRMPPDTREVALAMGWVMFRHPDKPTGAPFWKQVKQILRANALGKPRVWDLLAADAPRYEQPRQGWSMPGSCEGPRLRPYQARRREGDEATIVYGASSAAHDHTEGGRICGASGAIQVVETDMVTGWTQDHWFCRRHAERAREVKAQLQDRGEPPPPIPNRGGLLPCYYKADWATLYTQAVGQSIGAPYVWEVPYHGLSADDWPIPGKQPIPRRPRLSVIS